MSADEHEPTTYEEPAAPHGSTNVVETHNTDTDVIADREVRYPSPSN
jgi:hypothetical protein